MSIRILKVNGVIGGLRIGIGYWLYCVFVVGLLLLCLFLILRNN
jgi:hypothetical protein